MPAPLETQPIHEVTYWPFVTVNDNTDEIVSAPVNVNGRFIFSRSKQLIGSGDVIQHDIRLTDLSVEIPEQSIVKQGHGKLSANPEGLYIVASNFVSSSIDNKHKRITSLLIRYKRRSPLTPIQVWNVSGPNHTFTRTVNARFYGAESGEVNGTTFQGKLENYGNQPLGIGSVVANINSNTEYKSKDLFVVVSETSEAPFVGFVNKLTVKFNPQ